MPAKRSGSESNKPNKPEHIGKRVVFDAEQRREIDVLARSRMMTFQELADEAFIDVLRKHGRPYDTRDAFKKSARMAQANDNPADRTKRRPKSKRPAGIRRARS